MKDNDKINLDALGAEQLSVIKKFRSYKKLVLPQRKAASQK